MFKNLNVWLLASLLVSRGVRTYDEAKLFFRPSLDDLHDPFLMKDMDKAVNRILSAIDSNELYAGLKKYYENINRADSIQEALANLNNNYQDARILICGSLYLAGKVLEMN